MPVYSCRFRVLLREGNSNLLALIQKHELIKKALAEATGRSTSEAGGHGLCY